MNRVLAVSYAFPPLSSPEAFVAAKALTGLPGSKVDVITLDHELCGLPTDESLRSYVKEHYSRVGEVSCSLLRSVWMSSGIVHRLMPSKFDRPDPMALMLNRVMKAIREIDLGDYDLLHTRSQWHSNHMVGLEIKKINPDMPWVASMSDPWTDNPFRRWRAGALQVSQGLEASVMNLADAIVVPSQVMANGLARRYPDLADKLNVVHHAYDPALYQGLGEASGDMEHREVLLRHVGSFYGPRSPEPLIKAVEELSIADPEVLDGLRIEMIGPVPHSIDDAFAEAPAAARVISWRGVVDYIESLSLMASADGLLLIEAPAEESPFFPSKLADYYGSQKPILGIIPKGEAHNALTSTEDVTADPTDIKGIAAGLKGLIGHVRGSSHLHLDGVAGRTELINRYHVDEVRRSIDSVFNSVVP